MNAGPPAVAVVVVAPLRSEFPRPKSLSRLGSLPPILAFGYGGNEFVGWLLREPSGGERWRVARRKFHFIKFHSTALNGS